MGSTEQRIKTKKEKKKNSGQNKRISEQTLFNSGKRAKEKAASEKPKRERGKHAGGLTLALLKQNRSRQKREK